MAEVILRARIVRWVSDDFPGWVEVALVDPDGQKHRILEKVPAVTRREITAASTFPAPIWLEADANEIENERVEVQFAHGLRTTDSRSGAAMRDSDIEWL